MQRATQSDLLLIAVTLVAAISWMFSKEAIALMPPLLFMGLRFLLAAAFLACLGSRQLRQLTREHVLRSARVGIVFGIGMLFWVLGLAHSESMGEGAFLTSLGVLLVPIVARVFFAEPVPRSTWLAIPVALLGMAMLSLAHGFAVSAGQLYYLIAAVALAVFFTLNTRAATISMRRASARQAAAAMTAVDPLALTIIALTSVGLVTLLCSMLFETALLPAVQWSFDVFFWLFASAIVGTAARFWLQTYAQSLTTQTSGAVMLILEPIWVALFAALWFGETLATLQLMGCVMIFLALLVNRWQMLRSIITRRGL
ncbi:MAG: DMT family transporter [Thiopseudomonas sp.]|uniref:DMT family transporter n=1 Tax=Denitrificimonas caeni TaxID=521720 RepID=UPI0003B7A554|nr:DMT family transporter [Denitrificimonas caeni]MBP7188562.1 DMT family transporter [Thiopseudomonas sp.]HHX05292.1 DMT family transporter [Pseudomonas sp.]MBP7958907.1 DMT family transporter [Thiopseudomonas sp.]MBP8008182.1 DMT family transporter [Thiopseudomonas sp.]MBP8771051.1 DMT family transporter [Thiopseudomonas sp.]